MNEALVAEGMSATVGAAVWEPRSAPADLPYRELFLALAEALPDAVFTKDLQGRYTFIIGFIGTELCRLPLPEDARRELLEALSDAREGTERMRLIVQSLQSLSRGDAVAPRPLALHEVLESALRMASGRMGGGVRVLRDHGEVPRVLGHGVQLAQVFTNLLVNAAQALPPGGGDIHLVTRRLGRSAAVVEVRDTGCGIPAEHLERIFEPFFTTKPVGEGTGLGLSLCHDIIRGLGGVMTVDSLVGEGSSFRVFLNVAELETEEARG
ncbi:sensor histidine kinase [Archangium violaceum]|uniref:sensor histidine kinase n=1 Tax=Archangium violaceum TaxID=83451 RepID=UPI0006967DF7|nr:ATP-binding protein [Archangium violaceum]